MRVRRYLIGIILVGLTVGSYGCVTIFAAGAITGATQYLKYTMDSIAHRTFFKDIAQLTQVSVGVLKKMKIHVLAVNNDEEGAKIHAFANDLTIKIMLQPISENTTKISIDASKYSVIKDRATADEIISQIGSTLSDQRIVLGKRLQGYLNKQ